MTGGRAKVIITSILQMRKQSLLYFSFRIMPHFLQHTSSPGNST